MLTIGRYSVTLLETCRFGLDGGAMFGVVPKTLWERAYAPADAKNRIPMAAKALLLRSDDRTILVDTGNSPSMPEKLLEIYGITFADHSIGGSLDRCGVAPEDVTDVVLTHLHFDHVGGAVLADGTPRFPNARHYVQRAHYAWAQAPTEKDRASFMPEMYEPLVQAGRMEFIDGPGELFPGIHVDPLFGHTQAMQSVRVTDGSTTLFYPADLMPTGAHIGVPYVMGYDNHPLTTIDEKKRLLPSIIDEEWIVVFEHDALRDAARIVRGAKGPELSEPIVLTA
jgi:glyoxylase-like metal-dependent hydrolase (beta-lactamase superfamily II)